MSKGIPIHGRDHRPGGADPIWAIYKIKLFDDATVGFAGDGRWILIVTAAEGIAGLKLVGVSAGVSTVSSSGVVTLQVRRVNDATDLLSTRLTIDAGEFSSDDAAAAAVIAPASALVAAGHRYAVDIDIAGAGAKGHEVTLVYG